MTLPPRPPSSWTRQQKCTPSIITSRRRAVGTNQHSYLTGNFAGFLRLADFVRLFGGVILESFGGNSASAFSGFRAGASQFRNGGKNRRAQGLQATPGGSLFFNFWTHRLYGTKKRLVCVCACGFGAFLFTVSHLRIHFQLRSRSLSLSLVQIGWKYFFVRGTLEIDRKACCLAIAC